MCVCTCMCVCVCARNTILWLYNLLFLRFQCINYCWSCKARCAHPCQWDRALYSCSTRATLKSLFLNENIREYSGEKSHERTDARHRRVWDLGQVKKLSPKLSKSTSTFRFADVPYACCKQDKTTHCSNLIVTGSHVFHLHIIAALHPHLIVLLHSLHPLTCTHTGGVQTATASTHW